MDQNEREDLITTIAFTIIMLINVAIIAYSVYRLMK